LEGDGGQGCTSSPSWDAASCCYAADGTWNAVHGSDSAKSAQREIRFFFPHRRSLQIPTAQGGKLNIPLSLEQTLCKGLAVLAREKPSHDLMVALAWLGEWMLNNNPNKPKIISAQDLQLNDVDDGAEFAQHAPDACGADADAAGTTVSFMAVMESGSGPDHTLVPGHTAPDDTLTCARGQGEEGVEGSAVPCTLAMIKPDAVAAGAAPVIMAKIAAAGFTIARQRQYTMYPAQAEQFYAEHAGKLFFSKLVEFMTSGPICAIELQAPDAVAAWRALMGPTSTVAAREQVPQSLRAQFGTDGTRNATHGSDSAASAAREIAFHFPPVQRTLAMIKPDAMAAGAAPAVRAAILGAGLSITREREYRMSPTQAQEFYREHAGKPFYGRLVEFMASGPICAMEVEGPGAVAAWRAVMGPTDSSAAKAAAPTTLRARFGTDGTRNAVHGSDSDASAAREIAFHFAAPCTGAAAEAAMEPLPAAGAAAEVPTMHAVPPTPSDSASPAAEAAAVTVQTAVRGHQARLRVQGMKADAAALAAAQAAEAAAEASVPDGSEAAPAAEAPAGAAEDAPAEGEAAPDAQTDTQTDAADEANSELEQPDKENVEDEADGAPGAPDVTDAAAEGSAELDAGEVEVGEDVE
jgi:nucleoside diphosphate kinase